MITALTNPIDELPDLGTVELSPEAAKRALDMLNSPRPQWVRDIVERKTHAREGSRA